MKFNGDFTLSMKSFVKEKMEKISQFIDYKDAVISYKSLKDGSYKVEISIGNNIRAMASGYDFYEIVPTVIEKLSSQIKKYRSSKSYSKKTFDILEASPEEDEDNERISKEKTIILEEESFDEAIDEMELLGHQFYVYKDIDRKGVCIVYKRYDGSYGLIECR